MAFAFVENWRHVCPVVTIYRVKQISARGNCSWRSRPISQRGRAHMKALAQIREQYSQSLGSDGRPRMTMELKEVALNVRDRGVGRLMKVSGVNRRAR